MTPLREGGSLPGLVEADDDGLYVVKFRGAGQGPRALVAEWLAGELARAIGLPVPDLVGVEIDPALGDAEPDEEIHDLVRASGGLNLGMDFLPGALAVQPGRRRPPSRSSTRTSRPTSCGSTRLVTNPDRTAQNPNLLVWHGRPWLIDHGAALYIHHTWRDPDEHARRPFERIRDHVLLPFAGSIVAADERHAARIDDALLTDARRRRSPTVAARRSARPATPRPSAPPTSGTCCRGSTAPRAFVEEAERARPAA